MAVIQKDIVVPDNLLPGIMSGEIDIMGLAKDADNGRIVKHLDAYDSNDSDSAVEAVAALAAVAAAALTALGFGIVGLIHQNKVKRFKEAMNAYINAVNDKDLNVDTINNLINALDKLKGKLRNNIQVQFSSEELTALIECLCNHTKTLAEANNISFNFEQTEEEKADQLLWFRKNLIKQRDIFELAA